MKTLTYVMLLLMSIMVASMTSQGQEKPLLTVLNFDSQGTEFTPVQLGNLARMEVEKLNRFEVMDRYDVAYLVEKHELQIDNCYGKICLTEIGEVLKADKMMSGTVETYGETMIVTIRLIDVQSKTIEKAHVIEFLNLPKQIRKIMQVAMRQTFGLETDAVLVSQLTQTDQLESQVLNPDVDRLNLSGPRFGGTYFIGDIANYVTAEKYEGGYGALPYMYMIGYQFEIQYLNAGKMQALFEVVPTITGAEQGLFLPNLNVMHGLRHNVWGWEFGMGLTLGVARKAQGYFDENDKWHLLSDWDGTGPLPYPEQQRIDSRGDFALNTGLIVALGKSFKSGRMNIPVNVFVIPSRDGYRTGITLGFNSKRGEKSAGQSRTLSEVLGGQ